LGNGSTATCGSFQVQDLLHALHIVPFLYFKEELDVTEVRQTLFDKLSPIARFRSKVESVAKTIGVQSAYTELDDETLKANMDVLAAWRFSTLTSTCSEDFQPFSKGHVQCL